jgi:hypothetical protein
MRSKLTRHCKGGSDRSRIPTLNTDGTSPIVVLGAKDIKTDGVRNVSR